MNPDLLKAARKAEGILFYYNVDLNDIDPLPILEALKNVLLISYDSSYDDESVPAPMFLSDNQDSFTLVNRKDGKLQYIIIYNQNLSHDQLRLALARELGHVVMDHDGTSSEYIWNEEASCFAHHFLCPLRLIEHKKIRSAKKIHFRPKYDSSLWGLKSIQHFPNLESVKEYVASDRTKRDRYIGVNSYYSPSDVEFVNPQDTDCLTGWKNCYTVVMNGHTVGYCGE